MNARQMKKRLKKRIYALEVDNHLMKDIISNSPDLKSFYDLFNQPLNVNYNTMQFDECKATVFLPPGSPVDEVALSSYKEELANELFVGLKDRVTYKLDSDSIWGPSRIDATIFVGRSDC